MRPYLFWMLGAAGVLLVLSRTEGGRSIVQKITAAGIEALAKLEGFSATAYNDPPGSDKWSIGFGHQIKPGEEAYMSNEITVEEGRRLLAQDTQIAQDAVRRHITWPLTEAQFDALTSFVYNIGESQFVVGTVPTKINAGNLKLAGETMKQYINAGGAVNAGLVKRRAQEAAVFM